jgi:hypothetical protein
MVSYLTWNYITSSPQTCIAGPGGGRGLFDITAFVIHRMGVVFLSQILDLILEYRTFREVSFTGQWLFPWGEGGGVQTSHMATL